MGQIVIFGSFSGFSGRGGFVFSKGKLGSLVLDSSTSCLAHLRCCVCKSGGLVYRTEDEPKTEDGYK